MGRVNRYPEISGWASSEVELLTAWADARHPPAPRRYASDQHSPFKRLCLRRMCRPVPKRLPDRFRPLCIQSVREHADGELVVGPHVGLHSPMVVEEMLPGTGGIATGRAPA